MRRLTGWAIGVVAALAACTSSPPPSPPSPPPASPLPDANPVGVLHEGHASLTFSGDLQGSREFDWELMSSDSDYTALTWGSGIATLDLFAGPGELTRGSHRSSSTLGLQLRLGDDTETFGSGNRDCTITFTRVTAERVSGRFRCSDLESMRGPRMLNVRGTFDARY
jgi:hypothetical protein